MDFVGGVSRGECVDNSINVVHQETTRGVWPVSSLLEIIENDAVGAQLETSYC